MIKCYILPTSIYNEDYTFDTYYWDYKKSLEEKEFGFFIELPCLPAFYLDSHDHRKGEMLCINKEHSSMLFEQLKEQLLDPCSVISKLIRQIRDGETDSDTRNIWATNIEGKEFFKNASNIQILKILCGVEQNMYWEPLYSGCWYMDRAFFNPNSEIVTIEVHHEL